MSFPRYESYKESGVEWLGEVPEHWDVRAIKHIVSIPITDGPHETPNFPDEGIPFVSAEAVSTGVIDFSKIRGFISESDHFRYSQKYLPQVGDIYMVKSGATTGITAIVEVDREFNIWSPLAAIRCGKRAIPRFILNFMRSKNFQEAVTLNWSFGTQQNIGMGVIENLAVTLPPIPEQQTIAAFLDRETTKIDALIAEQQRLIELLKEKRQAVISHAITTGLNPDVPMKDSGVEWLGEVPEHWDVKRLKEVCEIFPSNVDKKTYENEMPVLLCNYTDVYYNEKITSQIDFMVATASAEQVKKFTLREGDTIITKDSETADDIAIAAYVPQNMPGVICGYHLSMIRPREATCGAFMKRLFDSVYVKSCCAVYANGLTRVGLGQYALDNLEMPFPPKTEQAAIAAFLDQETTKLDTLTTEAKTAITLLQERRAALISAAVTGKIDVRGLVSAKTEVKAETVPC